MQSNSSITPNARCLRRVQTEAETMLWSRLRGRRFLDLRFRRQLPIGIFIADFACPERMVVIEVDGGVHEETVERDLERTKWLASRAYRVLRVPNSQVLNDLPSVMSRIRSFIETTPSLSGPTSLPGPAIWKGEVGPRERAG